MLDHTHHRIGLGNKLSQMHIIEMVNLNVTWCAITEIMAVFRIHALEINVRLLLASVTVGLDFSSVWYVT